MRSWIYSTGLALAGFAMLAVPRPAFAADPVVQSVQAAPAPLTGAELDDLAGGANEAVAMSNQNLEAVNSGNRIEAGQVITGSVTIGSGALSGFSGVGNFIMNTGNNNNLQSTMSVNVVMPTP